METIIDFANSLKGVIIAVVAVIGAFRLLIDEIKKLIDNIKNLIRKKEAKMEQKELTHPTKTKRAMGIWGILLLSFGIGTLLINATTDPLPPNVKLTKEAWEAFNKEDYQQAIKKAEKCIEDFEPTASSDQIRLEKNKTPLPPVGKVTENVKKVILERGILNDVATCWFIKGRSLEKLGRKPEAIQAYRKAEIYTYARTYDPSWDGFWSPSQGAMDRRTFLEGNP